MKSFNTDVLTTVFSSLNFLKVKKLAKNVSSPSFYELKTSIFKKYTLLSLRDLIFERN